MIATITISDLSIFFIAIAFFILALYLIPTIIQLRKTAKAMEEFSQDGKEVFKDISLLLKKVNNQSEDAAQVIKKITDVGLKAAYLVDMVLTQVRGPIIAIASIITGIEFGFKHLIKRGGNKDVGQ